MSEKKPIRDVLDPATLTNLLKQVQNTRKVIESRKLTDIDGVEYGSVEHMDTDKHVKYVLSGVHVPMDEIFKYAQSKCNVCNSKGYKVVNIDKRKIQEPGDYVLISSQPLDDLTPEQLKLWKENVAKQNAWRTMLPCQCALKRALKKERDLYANDWGNILVRIAYEETPFGEGA